MFGARRKQQAIRSSCGDSGFGAAGVLMVFGGIFIAWFIFMGIMDYIGDRHQRKVRDRRERNEIRTEKYVKNPQVKRRERGYQVKY